MGKYEGIKNPDLTDEEYEKARDQARAEAILWLAQHDGTNPGDFMGYWGCPSCNRRIDMIRPAGGDLVITCECGHPAVTFPLLHG